MLSHPVARTAFYCCTLRADDAACPVPVCGDRFAARFVDDDIRRDIAPATRLPRPAAGNVARHRIIDDLIRARLLREPAARILLIGAGFDTRAFRLTGGRWWELDDPELLAFKEERLPALSAPNPLTRVPMSLEHSTLAAHLAPLSGDDAALVVVEGVIPYLSDEAVSQLATTVRHALPGATLVADLMSPAFVRKYSGPIRAALARLGATFAERRRHPAQLIERAGYAVRGRQSIAGRAREAGTIRMPGWVLNTLLRDLRDGYAVWEFAPSRAIDATA